MRFPANAPKRRKPETGLPPTDLLGGLTLEQRLARFNPKQLFVFQQIVEAGRSGLIHGEGGTGKSEIILAVRQWLAEEKKVVAVGAASGQAAFRIGGETIHQLLRLPVVKDKFVQDQPDWFATELIEKAVSKAHREFKENGYSIKWANIDLIILDEGSTIHRRLFEVFDEYLRAMRMSDEAFGGIQIVIAADFKQIPPIVDLKNNIHGYQRVEEAYILCSPVWTHSLRPHIWQLTQSHRQAGDPEFCSLLRRVRNGKMTDADHRLLEDHSRDNRDVVGKIAMATGLPRHLANVIAKTIRTPVQPKICALNKECEAFNRENFDALTGRSVCYVMSSEHECARSASLSDRQRALVRVLEEKTRKFSRMEEMLEVKEGTRVMLTYNLDTEAGLANGAVGTVVDFESIPSARIIVRFDHDPTNPVAIQRLTLRREPDNLPGGGVIVVSQIPLVHAWAVTAHKIQGATLDAAIIKADNVFEKGQFYVMISRLRNIHGLILEGYKRECVKWSAFINEYFEEFENEDQDAR